MYIPQYKWNVKNVPILSREQIDTISEGFLADFQPRALKEPQAVDVDGFLEMYLGVTPDYQYLSHNMIYLGMSVFHDTDSIPVYDPVTDRVEYFSAKANTVIFDRRLLTKKNKSIVTALPAVMKVGISFFIPHTSNEFGRFVNCSEWMMNCSLSATALISLRKRRNSSKRIMTGLNGRLISFQALFLCQSQQYSYCWMISILKVLVFLELSMKWLSSSIGP